MNNLKPGDRRTDGVNKLKYWGKYMSSTRSKYMIYIFFDDKDKCHELRASQVIKLKRY